MSENIEANVHIYITLTNVFFVPVSKHPDGMWLEIEPVTSEPRDTENLKQLVSILDSVVNISKNNMLDPDMNRWQGELVWEKSSILIDVKFLINSVTVSKKVIQNSPDPDEPPYWTTELSKSVPVNSSYSLLIDTIVRLYQD